MAMRMRARGDKVILRREDVFEKSWAALRALGIVMPEKMPTVPGKPDPNLTVFARIVSIGPKVEEKDLHVGQLVVFGTAAQCRFRDGSEFVITTAAGLLADIVEDLADADVDAADPTVFGRRPGAVPAASSVDGAVAS